MIKNLLITTLLSIFLLSSCGGGGDSKETKEESLVLPLKLTVGNVSIDSTSTLSRATIKISEETVNITTISTNKPATIRADGGADSDLFVLKDGEDNNSMELAFISRREANNPTDSNQDGVYEVDIQAVDEDGQIAIFKVAYKIKLQQALELRIDNKVVDLTKAHDEISVDVNRSLLMTLSVNNSATITLPNFSPDNKFFELFDNNGTQELRFKSQLHADTPMDSNRDGIYNAELEIKSSRKIIYYTIPFKIGKPIYQTLLAGETYFWKTDTNIKENTMSHIRFRPYHNQAFITNDESKRENEKLYDVEYFNTEVIVKAEDNSTFLSCRGDGSDEIPSGFIIFLECQQKVNNKPSTFWMVADPDSAEDIAKDPYR